MLDIKKLEHIKGILGNEQWELGGTYDSTDPVLGSCYSEINTRHGKRDHAGFALIITKMEDSVEVSPQQQARIELIMELANNLDEVIEKFKDDTGGKYEALAGKIRRFGCECAVNKKEAAWRSIEDESEAERASAQVWGTVESVLCLALGEE